MQRIQSSKWLLYIFSSRYVSLLILRDDYFYSSTSDGVGIDF